MVNIFKRAGKRILAGFLSVAMAATALPLQSFAEEGIMPIASDGWTSTWRDKVFDPSDGGSAGNDEYKYIDENGHLQNHEGATTPSPLAVERGTGESRKAYVGICIGCGLEYKKDEPYVEKTTSNSDYWNNKMIAESTIMGGKTKKDYQDLIALALYFGYDGRYNEDTANDPKYSQIPGSNIDDWIIATQVLVWEIQQGIRYGSKGSAGEHKDINTGLLALVIGESNIGDWLQQRLGASDSKRTKIYNYILESMEAYRTVPSFSQSDDKYSAKTTNLGTVTMKYDSSKGEYIGTIKDTNGTKHAEFFKNLSGDEKITVSANENSDGSTTYTFSCKKDVGEDLAASKKVIKMGKDAKSTSLSEGITIFEHESRSDLQPLIIGSHDAVRYYVNVRAEGQATGDGAIVKELEMDGKPYTPDNKADVLNSLGFEVYSSSTLTSANLVHFTGSDGNYTYSESTGNQTRLKLNSNGKAILNDLPPKTYYVKEYSSDPDYSLSGSNPKTLTIQEKSTSSTTIVTFTNYRETGDGKIKKTFVNSIDTLTAAEKTALYNKLSFTVKDSNGEYVHATGSSGSYTFSSMSNTAQNFKLNSSNGELTISDIPTGTYTVTEISTAEDYTPEDSTKTLTITKDGEDTASFKNTYNKINLTISKEASDGIISGIRFRVKNASGTFDQTYSTNSKGVIEIKGIDPDTYTVTELDHDGYDIKPSNPQTQTCTSGNTAYTFSFNNEEKFGDLKVYKDITNLPEGADKGRLRNLLRKINRQNNQR